LDPSSNSCYRTVPPWYSSHLRRWF
jgi:hypothetical protein